MHLLYLGFNPVDHRRSIGAVELHDHTCDDFFLAVEGLQPTTDGTSDLDGRDVAQVDRSTVVGLDDDVGQIVDAMGQAFGAHHELLGVRRQKLRSDTDVVLADAGNHVLQ